MSDKKAEPIQTILQKILNKYDLQTSVESDLLLENWSKIVGPKLANVCTPVEIKDNTLIIKTKNNVWRNELALGEKDLLNLLIAQTHLTVIKRIKFI